MARYSIPPNTGKVRVVMGRAGTYAVWNGKPDRPHEFRIHVRKRETAEELARIINTKQHNGSIEVLE